MAWRIGRYSRPRLGRLAAWRSGWASSTRESAGYAAPGRSQRQTLTRTPQCFGMWHAGRGQHRSALEAFAAAAQAQSLLTGVHALAPRITGWLAAMQARLGMLDEARATLAGSSAEPERMGAIYNTRAL